MTVTLIVANVVIFGSMAVYAAVAARTVASPLIGRMWQLAVLPIAAVLLGSIHRAALQAARLGWLPSKMLGALLTDWQVVQSAGVATIGIATFLGMRNLSSRLVDLEAVAGLMVDRAASIAVDSLGLTPREREVLELFGSATGTDDRALADHLGISTATAHSHVTSLLRKSGLSDRRDLIALCYLVRNRVGNG